jgi:small subunit ribosomal protein S2
MADVSLKELLESGAHFGHQTHRWNPKMKQYIYGARGGVHIIDLTHTKSKLDEAVEFVKKTAADGGPVLFVGTKRQAKNIVKAEAEAAGMPFVSERWLGGMLTNFRTIRLQINRLRKLEQGLESGDFAAKYNKKELLDITNEVAALNRIFGGVKTLDKLPEIVVVVDVPKEDIAVAEANKLGIPVVALVDTNANPDVIDYPIPANDDAIKAVQLIVHTLAQAAADGAKQAAKKAAEDKDGE